jgi:hypothetical protein
VHCLAPAFQSRACPETPLRAHRSLLPLPQPSRKLPYSRTVATFVCNANLFLEFVEVFAFNIQTFLLIVVLFSFLASTFLDDVELFFDFIVTFLDYVEALFESITAFLDFTVLFLDFTVLFLDFTVTFSLLACRFSSESGAEPFGEFRTRHRGSYLCFSYGRDALRRVR